RLMRDEDAGIVPVCQDGRILGVVTDRDLAVRFLAEGGDPDRVPVSEIMTGDVQVAMPDDLLVDAIRVMGEEHVRRLPVVDRDDRIIGILSMTDVAREAEVDYAPQDALDRIASRRSFWSRWGEFPAPPCNSYRPEAACAGVAAPPCNSHRFPLGTSAIGHSNPAILRRFSMGRMASRSQGSKARSTRASRPDSEATMRLSTLPASSGSLAMYLSEINQYPLLTQEEEQALARRYRDHGDEEAAHRLVTANLRFVVKVSYEYRSYGIKMADLIQEGNIGLMKAVKKFDPDEGIRLISYGVWWIRAYIQNYNLKSWSLVKLGTTQAQRKLFFSLARTKRELEKMGHNDGSGEDERKIAKKLHV